MSNVRLSGFFRADYLITFEVARPEARQALVALCEGDWQGDRIGPGSYELTTPLGADALEEALVNLLEPGDQAAFYYLSDSKRIFRVALSG